jgi:hypothetical protein
MSARDRERESISRNQRVSDGTYPRTMIGVKIAFSCTCQPNKKKHREHNVTPRMKLGHVGFVNTDHINGLQHQAAL